MHKNSIELRRRKVLLLVTASAGMAVLVAPSAAWAQAAPAAAPANPNEILVTARRGVENVQDVPVSVQVVSGDRLEELAITQVEELSKLAPGLTLVNNAASTQITLRGVSWRPGSGTPATPLYINEVPFDPQNTVTSIFDVEQIEVLRGPQGTSRGAPSISGAVTITTRRPDLNEFGGFGQALYGSAEHWALQAGINVPIVPDMLAVRFAANLENSEFNRIYSVNSAQEPELRDRSFRGTVLFEPTDNISITGMFQRRTTNKASFTQVVGTGSPGAPASPVAFLGALGAIPANFNGPALTLEDRASVQDAPSTANEKVDLLTINASWDVFGHTLSYNFGRQFTRSGASFATADPLNMIPGFEAYTSPTNVGLPDFRTHEVRLSAQRIADLPIDYDIGWFSKHSDGVINFDAPTYLAGAFGGPTALPGTVRTPNAAYTLNSSTNIGIGQFFDSFYGNLTVHITDDTELRGGVAFVRDRVPVSLVISTFPALNNIGNLNVVRLGFPAQFQPLVTSCEIVGQFSGANIVSSTAYPGTCDAVVPAGVGNSTQNNNDIYHDTIYNFSLSHRFTDDFMVYATTGSSFRTGLPAINNPGLPASLVTPAPETAQTYEIGVKTSPADGITINGAVFQIDYNDQLTTFEGVRYWNTISGRVANTSLAFYSNIDSQVRGFELELAARPIDNLSLGANIAYAQIKSKGGSVPCNDTAQPEISAANPINFCTSPEGQVLNQDSPWSITANGGYELPLGSFNGYVRFNVSYRGDNPNFGNFASNGVSREAEAYTIVDLFAGVAGQEGEWDLGFYAKNVFDTQRELTRTNVLNNVYAPYAVAPSGYNTVSTNLPREIGVVLRFAFGSR